MNVLRLAITDEHGDVSHARIIALLVGVSATVFMWVLTISESITLYYFIAYLAYGVVHQSVNKSLDLLRSIFGRQ